GDRPSGDGLDRSGPFDPDRFELPAALEATSPPEARGLRRDGVRLLVARGAEAPRLEHRYFTDLPSLLDPGDVLVVNTSVTLPASLSGRTRRGEPAALQLSGRLPGGQWMVELRHRNPVAEGDTTSPWLDAPAGTIVALPAGGEAQLLAPAVPAHLLGRVEDGRPPAGVRLWIAALC